MVTEASLPSDERHAQEHDEDPLLGESSQISPPSILVLGVFLLLAAIFTCPLQWFFFSPL